MSKRISEDTLLVRWDKKEKDFKVWYPGGHRGTGGYVLGELCWDNNRVCKKCFSIVERPGYESSFIKEMEKRGFDPTTLRLTIKIKT